MSNKKAEATINSATTTTTTTTPQEVKASTPQEKPVVNILRFNPRTLDVESRTVNLNLKNVKNADYFTRGLLFYMYPALKAQINSKKDAFNETLNTATTDDERNAAKDLLAHCDKLIDVLSASEKKLAFVDVDKQLYSKDNFVRLFAFLLFGTEITLYNSDGIMNAVKKLTEIRYERKPQKEEVEAFKALKEACNTAMLAYATEDNSHYSKMNLTVNSEMVEKVYQVFYKGVRLNNKTGNFAGGFRKPKGIYNEILGQIAAKMQRTINE